MKNSNYYENHRKDILSLIAYKKNLRILELGSGNANNIFWLKKNKIAKYVAGIDLFKINDSFQHSEIIDEFHISDLNNFDLALLKNNKFDVIIAGDVLEHLFDPSEIVKKFSGLLDKNGIWLVSIPNFREISNLFNVFLKGDFKYENAGILDNTHLRFFCRKNIIEFFKDFKVDLYSGFDLGNSPKRKLLNKLTLGFFREFLTYQYIIKAERW